MTASIKINRQRMRAAMAMAAVACAMIAAPAHAGGAFDQAGKNIVEITNNAITVAKKVLLTAAVLSLIVGLAPMLWGQIKVKWIISSLVACVLFGLTGTIVSAFAGT